MRANLFPQQTRPTAKLIGDAPSATAILDRFLHHAEIINIMGKSYRLHNQATGKSNRSAKNKENMKLFAADSTLSCTPVASWRRILSA